MGVMTIPAVRSQDTGKTLTQLLRLVLNGLLEDVFAEAQVDGEQITAAQFEVLRYIDRHHQPTVKQVAGALRISSAAATKATAGLSELRAVPLVGKAKGSDRREVRLTTTAAGHELVERVQDGFAARLGSILAAMSADDRAALDRGLGAFLRAALCEPDDFDAACLRCGIDCSDECLVHLVELEQNGGRVTAAEHRWA